tara:strand:+ start:3220 stop:3471 length:252 start_codon:yes stop_codon:yes gene_type:complete
MDKLTPEQVAKAEAVLAGKGFNVVKRYTDPKTMDVNELCFTLNNLSAIASAKKSMERKGWSSHPYLTHIEACKTQLKALAKLK